MSIIRDERAPQKLCFVTIGATAGFDSLIRAAINPEFLRALKDCGYTDLRLQHGKTGHSILQELRLHENFGIRISGFDFNKQGLGDEMRSAKGDKGRQEGAVISHAGTFPLPACTKSWAHISPQGLAPSLMLSESPSR